jgi:hypothetical protein
MMPESSSYLYFQLGMNADDDGFCEHFSIMRMVGAKPDDLKILQAKGFVQVFDDKVLVITDWKEHNYIPKDRYTPSKYLEQYKEEILQISRDGANIKLPLPDRIQPVYKMDTQVRLGKDRVVNTQDAKASRESEDFIRLFRGVNQRESSARLLEIHDHSWWANFMAVYSVKMRQDRFCPKATTPLQMEEQLGKIIAYGVGLQASEIKNKVKVI